MTDLIDSKTRQKLGELPATEPVPRQGDILRFGNMMFKVINVIRSYNTNYTTKSVDVVIERGQIERPAPPHLGTMSYPEPIKTLRLYEGSSPALNDWDGEEDDDEDDDEEKDADEL